MEISNSLLKILACPVSGGKLIYDRHNRELISETAGLSYPIIDSIPILLADKARKISSSSIKAIIEKLNEEQSEEAEDNKQSVSASKKISEVA